MTLPFNSVVRVDQTGAFNFKTHTTSAANSSGTDWNIVSAGINCWMQDLYLQQGCKNNPKLWEMPLMSLVYSSLLVHFFIPFIFFPPFSADICQGRVMLAKIQISFVLAAQCFFFKFLIWYLVGCDDLLSDNIGLILVENHSVGHRNIWLSQWTLNVIKNELVIVCFTLKRCCYGLMVSLAMRSVESNSNILHYYNLYYSETFVQSCTVWVLCF